MIESALVSLQVKPTTPYASPTTFFVREAADTLVPSRSCAQHQELIGPRPTEEETYPRACGQRLHLWLSTSYHCAYRLTQSRRHALIWQSCRRPPGNQPSAKWHLTSVVSTPQHHLQRDATQDWRTPTQHPDPRTRVKSDNVTHPEAWAIINIPLVTRRVQPSCPCHRASLFITCTADTRAKPASKRCRDPTRHSLLIKPGTVVTQLVTQ